MPNVLPTIPNDPPQGIQALLDKVYLWNPDVSNELIGKINALLTKLGDAIGAIRPYNELVAPINQYEPCYYGDGVYVAKNYLAERAEEFNDEDWILIARKGMTPEEADEKFLPLTGGELKGELTLNSSERPAQHIKLLAPSDTPSRRYGWIIGQNEVNNLVIRHTYASFNPATDTPNYKTYLTISGSGYLLPGEVKSIGGSGTSSFKHIYVKNINNGADLKVPTLAGTLARLEDLTAGNVSINFAGQEDTLQNAVNTLKTDQGELGDQVSAIESKIPADASETNQLVTKNEVLALPTFTYKVVQELPETGEEKIIYLVPKAGEGNDVHDEYIWVNSAYELIGTTAVDLSDYLPLSGGTLTGRLVTQQVFPDKNNEYTLGVATYAYKTVYTKSISCSTAGKLILPEAGGTLARIEDIKQIQVLEFPENAPENSIFQYVGETNDKYTYGYFYTNKGGASELLPEFVSGSEYVSDPDVMFKKVYSDLGLEAQAGDYFILNVNHGSASWANFVQIRLTRDGSETNEYIQLSSSEEVLSGYGLSFAADTYPEIRYTIISGGGADWVQINVQDSGGGTSVTIRNWA